MAGISMWVGILLALLLCFAVAISCSEFGLRSTLKFTPVLLLQLSFKTIWVIGVGFPILLTGKVPSYAIFVIAIFITYIIGDLIAIPFSYVFGKLSDQ